MIGSIVTICTGNICRSPVAAAALKSFVPNLAIRSAGLHAVVGRGVDPDSKAAAESLGIPIQGHVAQQFTRQIGQDADLLLVMEQAQRQEIARLWPQFLGKTFLLGHFEGGKQIADPYRQGAMMHMRMAENVLESAQHWSCQLRNM